MLLALLYAAAYSLGLAGLLSTGFTTRYWSRAFESGEVATSLLFSLAVAATATVLGGTLALAVVLLARAKLSRGVVADLLHIPLALPLSIVGFLAVQVLGASGTVGRLLYALGAITAPEQFGGAVNDSYGIGIVLAQLVPTVPLLALLFAQLYRSERLEELGSLAATLGASRTTTLRRITVPLLVRRALPTLLLTLVATAGAYEIPLLVGAQSPQMISVLTMRKYGMFDISQKPEAFICAILYTALCAGAVMLAQRRRGDEAA